MGMNRRGKGQHRAASRESPFAGRSQPPPSIFCGCARGTRKFDCVVRTLRHPANDFPFIRIGVEVPGEIHRNAPTATPRAEFRTRPRAPATTDQVKKVIASLEAIVESPLVRQQHLATRRLRCDGIPREGRPGAIAIFKTRRISARSSLVKSSNKNRGPLAAYIRRARMGATHQKSTPFFSNSTKWSKVTKGPRHPGNIVALGFVLCAPTPIQLIL